MPNNKFFYIKSNKINDMKTLKFSNGDIIPQFGLGTWLSKPNEVYDAVIEAIKVGYRHIDCAYIYRNEKEIGEAFKFAFETGLVKREELFVTSKLWNSYHQPEVVEDAMRKSLEDLQLDYLDLYLMHWPLAFKSEQAQSAADLYSLEDMPLEKTFAAMVELKKKGLVRHVGVSNFSVHKLKKLIASGEKPEMNQIEIHPYFQQDELIQFCKVNEILVTAYSPLGSRHLMTNEESIAKNSVIVDIAKKHSCSPAQVILAWGMQRDVIVIPKSVNSERIKENFGAVSVNLDSEDMDKITSLNRNLRNAKGLYAVLPGGPYTYENIWDEE